MDIFTAEELKAIEFCMRNTIAYSKQAIENSSSSDEDREPALTALSKIEELHKRVEKLYVVQNFMENM